MFMFRSKRSNLTKRLVKAHHKRRGDEARHGAPEEEAHRALKELLERLKENQLEMLLTAVESRGHDAANCVLVSRECDPHVLFCQTWRWPDVRGSEELRRVPACRSASDPVYICCNPFHWSRLCQPESPPPPYSRAMDTFKPEDRAPSEARIVCRDTYTGSIATDGEGSSINPHEWCKLAYWELSKRVGPLFRVERPYENVFGDNPYGGNGLSLEQLAQQCYPESVCKIRNKIGLGVTISREEDGIWVYNHSENTIFVNSLTLEDANLPSPTRVPAEHCLCVFDPAKAALQTYGCTFATNQGPIDINSVQISFAKGWGPSYHRQGITSCPCWIEILLAPCR